MGFNKKFLTEDVLINWYHRGGATLVFEELSNADALLSTDELSIKVVEYTNLPKEEMLTKIEELLSTQE
jgi:hypothetical protein